MTQDTQAILLLCAYQGGESRYHPLNVSEYNRVATVLHRLDLRPKDLLTQWPDLDISEDANISKDRIDWLFDRKINLAFQLNEWIANGIWIFARSDPDYPEMIRKALGNLAPPLLFGSGDHELLSCGGSAILGPDSIPNSRIKQSCEIADRFHSEKKTVIVGGRFKMANEIVKTTLTHKRKMIWVLFEGHLKQRLKKPIRRAIRNNNLVLVTPQSPRTPKDTGDKGYVGKIATALTHEILYVDGSNFKDQSKRTDQYQIGSSVMDHAENASLLAGRTISPEGTILYENDIPLWSGSNDD